MPEKPYTAEAVPKSSAMRRAHRVNWAGGLPPAGCWRMLRSVCREPRLIRAPAAALGRLAARAAPRLLSAHDVDQRSDRNLIEQIDDIVVAHTDATVRGRSADAAFLGGAVDINVAVVRIDTLAFIAPRLQSL